MAHNCIYCSCDCFCNGDIDDCNIWGDNYLHCTGCGSDLDEQDEDYYDDDGYTEDDIGDWPNDYTDNEPIQRKN